MLPIISAKKFLGNFPFETEKNKSHPPKLTDDDVVTEFQHVLV
jgi:hypothetical protein